MKAMILAAGYGERLWPLTADRTKPALPVLGKPLVGYVAEYLAQFGVRDIVVSLQYVHEPIILGTSGALDNARQFFVDETFVVVNGKIITNIDLGAAMDTHRRTKALATLVLKKNPARERFSVVEAENGLVQRFGNLPAPIVARELSNGRSDMPLMFT